MSALTRLSLLSAALILAVSPPALAGGVPAHAGARPLHLPVCDAPSVVGAVRHAIARADVDYRDGIVIETMDMIGQTAVSQDNPSPLARRFCRARARLSDGRPHPVYYMIEEKAGFVGLSWNVEACLPGHDRWRVHDGNCRAVRH